MVELGIDTSVFERAAALLNRPLSPTALEKEQLQKGRQLPESEPARKPQAKAKGKAKAKAAPTIEPPTDEQQGSKAPAETSVEAQQDGADNRETVTNAVVDEAPSILAAVAELSGLQKDWKQKINSPSYRKAPVPRLNRKQPKTLTDEERHEKLGEIDALEQELEAAKAKAAEVTAAAQRATEWVSQKVGESESAAGGSCEDNDTHPQAHDYRHLAEERVKERRRKEAHERRERERRESLERQAKHLEAEAKAKELERITKERMQSRLREEKERQQREIEEANKQQQLREERAASVEELRVQAAKRVAEREEAMRRKAKEEVMSEAEERRRQEEESAAKAEEGRERTRLRMQQRAQEVRAKQLLEEEARQRRMQEDAAQAAERQAQAEISRARARARAAEFRQRCRDEEEERAFLQAEEAAIQEEWAQAALLERQQKRHWRTGEPPVSQSPRHIKQSASSDGRGEEAQQESRPATADSLSAAPPIKSVSSEAMANAPAMKKVAPIRAPGTEASKATKVPPRPPCDRSYSSQHKTPVSAGPKARSKPAQQGSNNMGKPRSRSLSVEAPAREGRSNAAQITDSSADGPIRCTVGFFGVNDIDYLNDEDNDDEIAVAAEEHVPRIAEVAQPQVRKTSSAESNRQRNSSRLASQPTKIPRAYSQPPPSRPPVMPGPVLGGSRPESPATPDSRYYDVPDYRLDSPAPATPLQRHDVPKDKVSSPLASPGAASNRSDPMDRRQQPQPWKQKAISVQPADFYLNKLKAARGHAPVNSGGSPVKKTSVPLAASEGSEAPAWGEGPKSYADMMRMRARVVEATQRQEEGAKFDRTNAVLQRVQQRAAQVPLRSAST
mmetsp:Transcript_33520/g.53422  ORF Transcript_33520/g.53422 Transcript_33520/m.53422 type:complete len:847 (-) Transcript_33520:76-2616(-)